jgi:hypothetical protein
MIGFCISRMGSSCTWKKRHLTAQLKQISVTIFCPIALSLSLFPPSLSLIFLSLPCPPLSLALLSPSFMPLSLFLSLSYLCLTLFHTLSYTSVSLFLCLSHTSLSLSHTFVSPSPIPFPPFSLYICLPLLYLRISPSIMPHSRFCSLSHSFYLTHTLFHTLSLSLSA